MGEPIRSVSFGDPEVKDGELVVPLTVSYRTAYGPNDVTAYLSKAKLETLEEKAKEGQDAIEAVMGATDA